MNRNHLIAGAVLVLVLLAGCSGGVEKSHDVVVYNPQTEIDASGDNAVWTWSADVDPPESEACDIKVTATLYDESGNEIDTVTKVLKNVDDGTERRTVSYIGPIEEVNNIVNYEITVSAPNC